MAVVLFLVGTPRVLWVSAERTQANMGSGLILHTILAVKKSTKGVQNLALSAITVPSSDWVLLPTHHHSIL